MDTAVAIIVATLAVPTTPTSTTVAETLRATHRERDRQERRGAWPPLRVPVGTTSTRIATETCTATKMATGSHEAAAVGLEAVVPET